MPRIEKAILAVFYQSPGGSEPVREWLKARPPQDRKTLGLDIATVEYGWPLGLPLCRSLGNGLWEVRSGIGDGKIARVIFCTMNDQMVLLHGFVKKTRKIPDKDLRLALKRKKEIE